MSDLDEILRCYMGEVFVVDDEDTFTIIGESQDGGLLIEWEGGNVDSMDADEFNDLYGYEMVHISQASESFWEL